jgi:Nucleotide modification associated domain 1
MEEKEKAAGAPKTEKSPAIKECEERYPETTKEFKKILNEQYELFTRKQNNYGPENISVGTKLSTPEEITLSLTGIWFRQNDKIQRLKQLVLLSKKDQVGESVQDTYSDLSVYSIIAQIVSRGKWGK